MSRRDPYGTGRSARSAHVRCVSRVFAAFSLVAIVAFHGGACAQPTWEHVLETDPRKHWLANVFIDSNEAMTWVAGGRDLLVSGSNTDASRLPLPGQMVEAFGRSADGSVDAVGADSAVWRRVNAHEWKLEHSEPRSRDRRKHLLTALYALALPEGPVLLTHAGTAYVLVRDAQGQWQAPKDPEQAKRLLSLAINGPALTLPQGCQSLQWRWIDAHSGLLLCRDDRVFLWNGASLEPVGRMPHKCEIMFSVARRGQELFTSCGVEGTLLHYESKWLPVATMVGIRGVSANGRCVVVTSDRRVSRHCLPKRSGD